MQKILVVCPTRRDKRELLSLPSQHLYSFIFHDYTANHLQKFICDDDEIESNEDEILNIIDKITQTYKNDSLQGVISTDDYPGETIASIVADALKLPSPSPEVVLLCQHKYYSRLEQKKYVPEAVPRFALLDSHSFENKAPPLPFPFFLKPVKSCFSCFARVIDSQNDLCSYYKSLPDDGFTKPFNQMLQKYADLKYNANYLLAEELLEGHQGTIEGFIYKGNVSILGVVDSIMYPGTISFQRFEYPSGLPKDVQDKLSQIAAQCMQGMGFDNGIFNIEFMYNPVKNSLHIIEINPRIASQFADFYEKVDGKNSYEILLEIATGKKPTLNKRKGLYKLAASCVLREFENKKVIDIPDNESLEKIKKTFPGTRIDIYAQKGKRLSCELQDGKSYRYCLINLGADNHRDLESKLAHCIKELKFKFEKA